MRPASSAPSRPGSRRATSVPSSEPDRSVKWLLAGASGFLGKALRVRLAEDGHEVVRLVRREPATSTEFRWDPDAGELDPSALDGVDVVVNLGGVGVATRPWTASRREAILSSRVNTTRTLATALAGRVANG